MENRLKKIVMMIIIVVGISILGLTETKGDTWWNKEYPYRLSINIDNTQNNESLIDYQVLVILDTEKLILEGKMDKEGSDIRFVDSNNQEMNYWIEKGINTDYTKIWVKVPKIPAKSTETLYLYYGNKKASPVSNFDKTMTKDFKDKGLIGLWHFDEGKGEIVKNSSGNGNDGEIKGEPQWTKDDGGQWRDRSDVKFPEGSAIQLDGVSNFIAIPNSDSLNPTDGISLEAWVCISAVKDGHLGIIGRVWNEPYSLLIGPGKNFTFMLWSDDDLPGIDEPTLTADNSYRLSTPYQVSEVDIGKWLHIVGTYEKTTGLMKTYLNGEMVNSWDIGKRSIRKGMEGNPLLIGAGIPEAMRKELLFEGMIDEVRIYSRALSDKEVKAHYERRRYSELEPVVQIGKEEIGQK